MEHLPVVFLEPGDLPPGHRILQAGAARDVVMPARKLAGEAAELQHSP
jgi:hypothetical protein